MPEVYQVPPPVLTGDTPSPKPQAVTNGVILFCIAWVVSALSSVVAALNPVPGLNMQSSAIQFVFIFFFMAVFIAITLAAGQGKNWARITLLVIFCIFVPFALLGAFMVIGKAPLIALMGLVQQALEATGLFFLFSGPASAWYKSLRS